MTNDALKREIRRLRLKVYERDFRSAAPPLDEDGLPNWGGDGLSVESYSRLLDQDTPDEELTPSELETRHQLAPYASVFSRLEETENEEDEP
jgi:hypothetical protein